MSEVPEVDKSTAEREFIRGVKDAVFPFDPTLESLAMYVNLLDSAEVGVSLHMKGAVVSGLMISPRRFFKILVLSLEDSADENPDPENNGHRMFADFYQNNLDDFEKARDEYVHNNVLPPRPHHLHLRHVETYLGGPQPLIQATMRCRLTEVDAWTLGNFGGKIPQLDERFG